MTPQETAKILKIIKISYPIHSSKWSDDYKREMNLVWCDMFSDVEFELVQRALKLYMHESGTNFPPTPPTLFLWIDKILESQNKKSLDSHQLNKFEAWEMVEKAMKSGELHYEPSKAFSKLPKIIQKAIGNTATLVQWSRTDLSQMSFIQNKFYKRFDEYAEYAAEEDYTALTGETVKQLESRQMKYEKPMPIIDRLAQMFDAEQESVQAFMKNFE